MCAFPASAVLDGDNRLRVSLIWNFSDSARVGVRARKFQRHVETNVQRIKFHASNFNHDSLP
jgi:hypothetical protein